MAAGKLLNLIALTALALLASSLGPAPVNALSTGHFQQHAHRHIAQEVAAKRKRDTSSKRCKPRPSSAAPSSTPATTKPATTKAAATSTHASSQPPKSTAPAKPATSAVAPPPQTNSSPGKLGLAWPNGGDESLLKNFVTSRVKYMYTWSPNCPSNTFGVKCMPMMWGDKDDGAIKSLVSKASTAADNLILFLNEPNQDGQSNMSPQHGCDLYHQYLKPGEALGYKYITPATSSAPSGLTWVKDFLACCKDCQFSGVAIHWYDMSLQKFQDYVELWHNTFNMPIYVTEYALQNFSGGAQASPDQVTAFHKAAAAWMEQQDYIVTYMPFGFMNDMSGVNTANQLMNGNTPTALGKALLNGNF
ncbi:hypothetical protein EIP91_011076 [Steccherinum ochraceum]|uniref:Asl1-like glycosyl hydrolase catalytic domain-containing protein n=1 Tax=Steccherinum ochraceum TaxID=92696 RepID=A0A4R0RWP2_9APHY|nr:hypothetical protein EIP91_011076 [Steccherinum ochraceum]